MSNNSVELLIKEKLKAALNGQKKSIASGLLSTPTEPPIPAQGPMVANPVGGQGSVSSSTLGEEIEYKDHKITKAIPGYTPGAGKCKECGAPVSWQHSRMKYENGKQVGVMKTFHCDAHKPSLGEAFSRTGRPVSAAPSPGIGERRKRLVNKVQKSNIKLHDLQQQQTKSHDARGLGMKQRVAQTERSLALQKLHMAK